MADAFPISGSIDPKAFPFLLMDLHRQGATGSLKVEGPSYQKALYFRGGRILFGSSNDPRDQLGAILIENGKITPEQLEDVNTKVGPGNPLAKALAESGFVNQRELGEAARAKVERILSDVIAYTSGSFEFEDGVLPKGAVDLKLSTERLVMSAVRRVGDRNFVLRHLESLDVILVPTPDLGPRLPEIQGEAGGLPEQLDGRRTLREAAGLTRLDDFEAAKVACALLFLGLADLKPPTDLAAEAVAAFGSPGAVPAEFDLDRTAATAFTEEPATAITPLSESEPAFFVPEGTPPPYPPSYEPPARDSSEPTVVMAPPGVFASPPQPPEPTGFAMSEPSGFEMAEPPPPGLVPEPPPPPEPEIGIPPLSAPQVAIPEPEPPPPPVAKSPPSREDLAALDALLGSRTREGPLAPLEKPASRAERWEPRFPQAPRGRRPPPRRGAVPLLLGAVAVLAAGGGAAYWFYFSSPTAARPMARASASPSPVVSVATPTPSLPSPSALAASPEVTLPPPPTATPGATPAPAPTPSPAPQASPSPGPPLSRAVEARSLLQKGELPGAARGFAASLKTSPGTFSIQILVACSSETVMKAVQNVPSEDLYILPVTYKGRDCYRVCWGIYENQSRAESAVSTVPDYFRQGGAAPRVVATSGLLP